jgi:hypothetical protein
MAAIGLALSAWLDLLGLIGSGAALAWLWHGLACSALLGSSLLSLVWFGLVQFGRRQQQFCRYRVLPKWEC